MGFRWTAASQYGGGVTFIHHAATLVLAFVLSVAVVVVRIAHVGQRTLSLWLRDHSSHHAALVLEF